jgi:hypothetical protein
MFETLYRINPESADPMAALAADAKRAATCKGEWLFTMDWRCLPPPAGVPLRLDRPPPAVEEAVVDEERVGEAGGESVADWLPLDFVRWRSASCQQKSVPPADVAPADCC